MSYLYFPGCSLKETGKSYDESLRAIFAKLEIPLVELPDWNCCGATSYMAVNEMKAYALAARNLALAEETCNGESVVDVVAPCAACYMVLSKVQKYMNEFSEVSETIHGALNDAGLKYSGKVRMRHPLDVIVNDFGLNALVSKIQKPLTNLKIASYYGCQLVRPYAEFDDQDDPQTMDLIFKILGAETIDWPLKTRCCGGTLTGTVENVGLRLNDILIREAHKRGANTIATACSLCQFNLECYQNKIQKNYGTENIPVAYFTQIIGMALGISDKELGLHRSFVSFSKDLIKGGAACQGLK